MEEQHVFPNSILYLHIWQLGDDTLPKPTAEYLVLSPSLSRQKPPRPAESTRWLFTCSQCVLPQRHLPALSAGSREGLAFITAVQGARPRGFLSAVPITRTAVQLKLLCHTFCFGLCRSGGKKKTQTIGVDSFSPDRKMISRRQ